jgi:uncharacterized protein YcbK (DUF882 family)
MQTNIGRRDALRWAGAAALTTMAAGAANPASAFGLDIWEPRRALLHNLHTGEKFSEVYFANGSYLPGAMAGAMKVLRDWRNGAEHFMDPRLFDALHAIQLRLDTRQPFQIISGYRSPASNAMLHSRSGQVAEHSQHTQGKAVDVRVQGVDLRNLHKAAVNVSAGGVGFYPQSNFIHVDTGRVRQWSGS